MTKLPLPFLKTPLPLLIVLLISIPFQVNSQSQNTEQAILLGLKQQWGDPPFIQSWNSSSSPCNWPGISCTNGAVTKITLQNINITTKIPSTICDLKNLTFLDLAWNYIPGEFPTVLYNCSKLQYLDLSENFFVGPIPEDIYRIQTLQYIDLGANNFSGNIPKGIGNMTELKTLKLYQNQFNGTWPKEIGNLANLEVLSMPYNDKFVPTALPEEFGRLRKLTFLWMKRSNLIGQIPDYFSNFSSLEHLDLAYNDLVGAIPSGLFLIKSLKFVYLFANRLSGEIPSSIEASSSLERLEGFGKLRNLTVLRLFENQLTGEIPISIGQLPLIDFAVFRNKLIGTLPPELGMHSKLEAFEVSENQLSGQLPEHLCDGGALQGLVAFSNNLSGEVPKWVGNCPTLRTVQLQGNNFSGEVPSGLWTLFNLSSLMLSDNLFSGGLPSKLASNLTRVEIRNNRFSGEIPVGISSWVQLVVFDARNNLLSGKIPAELTSLSHLISLFLGGNQFSGELPSEMISWKLLTTLDLSRNKLSGQIPGVVGSLPDLNYLDLSNNQLSGEIPFNLMVNSLNLSYNQLSGKIPDQLNNLAYENSFLNNSNLCVASPILDLPSCYTKTLDSNNNKMPSIYLAMILVLVIVVLLVTVLLSLYKLSDYRRKKHQRNLATWKLTSFQRLNFTDLNILSNLTENNIIGSGGSGKVYRIPTDHPGQFVAVKSIWNDKTLDHKLEKEFLAEVDILGTIRHSNIVKLLCCISSENSKLLVYEYMENHSLDRWLHGKKRKSSIGMNSAHQMVLNWPRRLQIAIGTAQGLSYMHHDCSPPIIHRDVKSSNILLDSEFKASIADFGLAKMLEKHGESRTMSAIAGTFGYFAPEYTYITKVNEKIDVYSFGIVLLELVTGREPNDENMNIAEWALQHSSEEKSITDALDDEIKEPCYLEEMTMVFKLGLKCTSRLPANRPSMREVLQILCWCSPPRAYTVKKKGSDFDVAPLLESVSSNYKINREDANSLV
ncbi:receptor-like protein kinase HSL1 [Quercus suber]|uniref:receptor-like protein kinase HSL1 n=1 Tax=Quercus suber TaxID=58331 RepID=UPI0032DF3C83